MVDLPQVPDYSLLAQAYKIPYSKIKSSEETESILKKELRKKGPCIIEVDIDSEAFTAN